MSEQERPQGVIIGVITTISFGIIGMSIIAIILGVQVGLDLYTHLNLDSVEKLQPYIVIMLSWALGGAIAGIRSKDSTKGFISGFFGGFIGALLVLLLYFASLEGFLENFEIILTDFQNTLPGFFLGTIGIMISASITGFVAGKATTEPEKMKKIPQSKRKSWSDQSRWKCTKCSTDIPPGKMKCPNCGAPVI